MRYKPDITKYTYPDKTDVHMIKVKHQVDTHFDENHRYYNNTLWYRIIRFFGNIIIHLIAFPFMFFRYNLKIEGRENVKEAKKLKTSVMTICNHVFMIDYITILKAIRPKMEYVMAWPVNFEGPNRFFIKLIGGIPIPQKLKALPYFSKAIESCVNDKKWIHVFPEGSMWFYYPYIRPLKKGCFKYAQQYNLPILPMAISFRPRKGLLKYIFKSVPFVTLRVGKIMYVNNDLEKHEAIYDIQSRSYHEMQVLAGIPKGDPDYHTLEDYTEIKRV